MKQNKLYYFSVEGYNEKWYFEHLQKLINNSDESKYNVQFDIKIDRSPLSRKKSINVPVFSGQKLRLFHIVDYESNDPEHVKQFSGLLDELSEIRKKYKAYNYTLGYSNFAFELWLILHKSGNIHQVQDRSRYIDQINSLYNTNFQKMKSNKNQKTFERLLEQIGLEEVKRALANAEKVRKYQEDIGNRLMELKGFKYYRDNPDITVNECVKKIFDDCSLI